MKITLSLFFLLSTILGVAQSNTASASLKTEETKLEKLEIELTINSVEELEAFDLNDIKSIFEKSQDYPTFALQVVCKDTTDIRNNNWKMTYKIELENMDSDTIMEKLKKMKAMIKKSYSNKK